MEIAREKTHYFGNHWFTAARLDGCTQCEHFKGLFELCEDSWRGIFGTVQEGKCDNWKRKV